MDKVIEDVPKIERKLHELRTDLYTLDQEWENAARSETFVSIQVTSKQANLLITDLHSALSGVVPSIEAEIDYTSLEVIHKRGTWLHGELEVIVQHLQSANLHVTSAMNFTNNHTYQVMNVKEEVELGHCNLEEHQALVEKLLVQARHDLAEYKSKIELVRKSILSKNKEIAGNEQSIADQTETRNKLTSEAAAFETRRNVANENRKESRGWAIFSGIVTGVSILAIPVTFGASAVVGGVAGAAMAVNIDNTLDHKKEVKRLQASIGEAQRKISVLEQTISKLNQEKSALNREIVQIQKEIIGREAAIETLQKQITLKNSTVQQIDTLQSHAKSTLRAAEEALSELGGVRDSLEDCKDLIQQHSLEASKSMLSSQRLLGDTAIHKSKLSFKKEHQKQVNLLRTVLSSLGTVQKTMPLLTASDVGLYYSHMAIQDSLDRYNQQLDANLSVKSRLPGKSIFKSNLGIGHLIAFGLVLCIAVLTFDILMIAMRPVSSVFFLMVRSAMFVMGNFVRGPVTGFLVTAIGLAFVVILKDAKGRAKT